MIAQPKYSRVLMRSWRITAPDRAPNTASRLKSSDTTVGLESFCARIWSVYATPLEKLPTYKIGPRQIASDYTAGCDGAR